MFTIYRKLVLTCRTILYQIWPGFSFIRERLKFQNLWRRRLALVIKKTAFYIKKILNFIRTLGFRTLRDKLTKYKHNVHATLKAKKNKAVSTSFIVIQTYVYANAYMIKMCKVNQADWSHNVTNVFQYLARVCCRESWLLRTFSKP